VQEGLTAWHFNQIGADMAKGYKANKERQEDFAALGKGIGKRAGFKCEWCENKEDLRVWDHQPEAEPDMANLALLCRRCRELADGAKADPNELRSIRNALWSDIPAVAEGVAGVLSRCKEPWVREAIEESFIDDAVKARLLK
jgi:protein PhnA